MDSIPTVADALELKKLPKRIGQRIGWKDKQANRIPRIKEAKSSVHYYSVENAETGETIEGLLVRAQFSEPMYPGEKDKYGFGLYYKLSHRLYAIDINHSTPHLNKKKMALGREFSGQKIPGCHIHYWTEDGYGYAEPLHDKSRIKDILGHWEEFCELITIADHSGLILPNFDTETGQRPLL